MGDEGGGDFEFEDNCCFPHWTAAAGKKVVEEGVTGFINGFFCRGRGITVSQRVLGFNIDTIERRHVHAIRSNGISGEKESKRL